MDLEVVHHEGHLKILEIDARLPSQTPAVVERSTGINMLELLGDVFLRFRLPGVSMPKAQRGVVYEHIRVSNDRLEVSGEHIMAEAGPLHVEEGFFGGDLALTDFFSPARPWVATLIVSDATREGAWEKRCEIVETIMEACQLSAYHDPSPDNGPASKGRRQ
jgi:pyrrolysine biosynthesis protein PylC